MTFTSTDLAIMCSRIERRYRTTPRVLQKRKRTENG